MRTILRSCHPFSAIRSRLSTDALLNRRVEITCQLKNLEQERQVIDGELQNTFSDAELRFGVRVPGGWMLKQHSRTSWEYAPEVRESIKALQQQAQHSVRLQSGSEEGCLRQMLWGQHSAARAASREARAARSLNAAKQLRTWPSTHAGPRAFFSDRSSLKMCSSKRCRRELAAARKPSPSC